MTTKKDVIRLLREGGRTRKEVARLSGCSPSVVSRLAKAIGLPDARGMRIVPVTDVCRENSAAGVATPPPPE